jgi:hypothetical protein
MPSIPWFSPRRSPEVAGDLAAVLNKHPGDSNLAPEIRVSEAGKAALAEDGLSHEHGGRQGGKHRAGSGNRLKRDAQKDLVLQRCKEWKWDGTLKRLQEELKKDCNLKVSTPTLSRYLKGTEYDPARRKAARMVTHTNHAVAEGLRVTRNHNEGAADLSGVDAWTMPDDESVS